MDWTQKEPQKITEGREKKQQFSRWAGRQDPEGLMEFFSEEKGVGGGGGGGPSEKENL